MKKVVETRKRSMSSQNEKKKIKSQQKPKKTKISSKKIEKKIREKISKKSDKKNRKEVEKNKHKLRKGNFLFYLFKKMFYNEKPQNYLIFLFFRGNGSR